MDKKRLHHYYTLLRHLNVWLFLAMAAISAVIFVFAFRQNNLTMLRLRDEVIKADQENVDTEGALRNLREFVHAHMNTDLTPKEDSIRPPIQLKYRYERLLEADNKRITEAREKIYSEAQADCERRFPQGLSGSNRIPCVTEYVTRHPVPEPRPIPDDLYKFDFISPRWSPDVAGWSLVAAIVFLGLFLIRLGLEWWLRYELDKRL